MINEKFFDLLIISIMKCPEAINKLIKRYFFGRRFLIIGFEISI